MITGWFALDWALISVSLFNAMLLLWLGLTVFLNAERRTWGVWLVEEGLLLGALFFVSHTAILGRALMSPVSRGLEFWWRVGWMPVVLAPFAWYILILWYAGFWNSRESRLYRRHRTWLALVFSGAMMLVALMSFTRALPSYEQLIRIDFSQTRTIGGVPFLFVAYPIFAVLCIVLPFDVLRHPEPSQRMMGDLARHRARPWLLRASVVLLVVSLCLTLFMIWAGITARTRTADDITPNIVRRVAVVDLLLASLLAMVIMLLGQAIVSYEIFTGQTLPRRGFFRHWRNVVILAAGYSVLVGWSLSIQLAPIYSLLLSTLLVVVFYALFGWRSFVERDVFMARLRPFVSSQRLMQHLLPTGVSPISRATLLFQALCADVLGTQRGMLVPLGVLAPLAGPPLAYPRFDQEPPVRLLPDLFPSGSVDVAQLDTEVFPGFLWAIPLWAERGLIGALLLGPKQDNGLYTQEEIEIARTSAERIVDMLAGEQMARRLAELQRRRLTETRVVDLRTRRVLHDDVLPTLHTAILRLGSLTRDQPVVGEAIEALTDAHQKISELIHTSSGAMASMTNGRGITDALQVMIETEFADTFDAVTWQITEKAIELDPLVQDVVLNAVREAVRNAAVHGRGHDPQRSLKLAVSVSGAGGLTISIHDDGVGLDYQSRVVEKPLAPGSGGGLALHSTILAIVGGYLEVEPGIDIGTRVTITLPDGVGNSGLDSQSA